MTSIPAAVLLLSAVGLGFWLELRRPPPRLYWSGPPTLADCLQPAPKRLKGVRRG